MADDWIRDPESAERIRARTQEHSTQARHSRWPAALLLEYYEYDKRERLTCPACGWSGQGGQATVEYQRELFDVSCPGCDTMLLVVGYPTIQETKDAAAAGNPEAVAELPHLEKVEARRRRAAELELTAERDVPQLDGEELRFEWDLEESDRERWTVVRCEGTVVWRELAYWEGWPRFNAVKDILSRRYGGRFVAMEPQPASLTYLYGDDLGGGPA